eukprot:GHVT01101693.1.p2 GENE.GHVT01101693.1~~GHVT01101693.1.p2  ORF type:complete len:103 (+),score=16.75 GHVT01101693.1:377-685(+)
MFRRPLAGSCRPLPAPLSIRLPNSLKSTSAAAAGQPPLHGGFKKFQACPLPVGSPTNTTNSTNTNTTTNTISTTTATATAATSASTWSVTSRSPFMYLRSGV